MSQETMSLEEYNAYYNKPKTKEKKTGVGGALSGGVSAPEPEPSARLTPRQEYATRWKAGESVFLTTLHYKGRTRTYCLDADALFRVLARAPRANSHSLHIHLTTDD